MNYQIRPLTESEAIDARLRKCLQRLRPPPKLNLVEWADQFRHVSSRTSASPGRWKTIAQPCAFGPMAEATKHETHTISIMAGTQIIKTELLINLCGYYIAQDPSAILFVQPTQMKAEEFSKERFAPTVEVSPQLRALVEPPKTRDSENTITHKEFPGGVLNFVGANSPSDLSSRPVRVVLADEIDKYLPSAGSEGDPLKLAEERASTYKALGRAKFVRTCSPTVEGFSRIGREYAASDQRKLFVTCPHCDHAQVLTWANVRWDRDETGAHLPNTARLACDDCGVLWTERERIDALDALARAPGYGWRQTAPFVCCGETQVPSIWNDQGRSICVSCETPSPYSGHAGFHVSKLYSKRHRLPEIVQEFIEAKADLELLRKWTNTALAELWKPQYNEIFSEEKLMARAEPYGPDDLPNDIKVVTGFCDVQGDRLEIQLIGWGVEEECWPFQYSIINLDPAQPGAWRELDALLASTFKVTARTFKAARAAFGKAWRELLPTLTEANFQRWRDQRDFTSWKYRMWDCGCRMPTQNPDGRSRCFCGEAIDVAGVDRHIYAAHRAA
jgi:phage terminase large subunit GpA-like protein